MLTVSEHIAIVQRAQGIAKTDHAAMVRAQHELAEAQRELAEVRTGACAQDPATAHRAAASAAAGPASRAGHQRTAGPRAPARERAVAARQRRRS